MKLVSGLGPRLSRPGICLASVESRDGTFYSWATTDSAKGVPDQMWGAVGGEPLVASPSSPPTVSADVVDLPNSAVVAGAHVLEVSNDLNGPGEGFGKRFWSLIKQKTAPNVLALDASIVGVTYEDRYLVTPLSCALLVEVFSSLKQMYEQADCWGDPEIAVTTMFVDEGREPRSRDQWVTDWSRSDTRDAALGEAFNYCGIRATVTSRSKRDLIHGRRLVVRFSDGRSLTLWMDQGFSYWTVARQQVKTAAAMFSMNDDVAALGRRLAEIKVGVEGHGLPTQIFVNTP